MPPPHDDRELRCWLAFHVTTPELRDLIRDEFPALYIDLPGDPCAAAHLVSELFRVAGRHGVLPHLRAILRARWSPPSRVRAGDHGEPKPPGKRRLAVLAALCTLANTTASFAETGVSNTPVPITIGGHSDLDTTGDSADTTGDSRTTTDTTGATAETNNPPPDPPPRTAPTTGGNREPIPPRREPLSALIPKLKAALRPCALAVEGMDLEISVAADTAGVWKSAFVSMPPPSRQLNLCTAPALQQALRTAKNRRFLPGTTAKLILHIWE